MRPRIGTILKKSLDTLRDNAQVFAGIWAVCCVLPQALIFITSSAIGLHSEAINPGIQARDPRILGALVLISLVWFGFRLLGFAAVILMTAKSARGQPILFKELIVESINRFFPLTGALFLFLLSYFCGLVLLVLPGFFLLVRLGFVTCAVCADDLSPIAAFRRSWSLTEGDFWSTAGFLFAVTIAVFALLLIGLGFNAVVANTIGAHGSAGGAIAGLAMNTVQLLTASWGAACITNYFVESARKQEVPNV